MHLSFINTRGQAGLDAPPVTVEVHLSAARDGDLIRAVHCLTRPRPAYIIDNVKGGPRRDLNWERDLLNEAIEAGPEDAHGRGRDLTLLEASDGVVKGQLKATVARLRGLERPRERDRATERPRVALAVHDDVHDLNIRGACKADPHGARGAVGG